MKKLLLIPLVLLAMSCTHTYDIEATHAEYLKSKDSYALANKRVVVYSFTGTDTELDDELETIHYENFEYPFGVKRIVTKRVVNKK